MSDKNIKARGKGEEQGVAARRAVRLGVAGCLALASTQFAWAEPPPAEYQSVIGKQIWYAPHTGCLDRLRTRDADGTMVRGSRRYPEREIALTIRDAVRVDGRWMYRFDWVGEGGSGMTPADRVIADTRFQALPTTFYKTCFFLESPQALAGYLKAEHPQALQRYGAPSAADRQREIAAIEARDRQPKR